MKPALDTSSPTVVLVISWCSNPRQLAHQPPSVGSQPLLLASKQTTVRHVSAQCAGYRTASAFFPIWNRLTLDALPCSSNPHLPQSDVSPQLNSPRLTLTDPRLCEGAAGEAQPAPTVPLTAAAPPPCSVPPKGPPPARRRMRASSLDADTVVCALCSPVVPRLLVTGWHGRLGFGAESTN